MTANVDRLPPVLNTDGLIQSCVVATTGPLTPEDWMQLGKMQLFVFDCRFVANWHKYRRRRQGRTT